jgi:integrase
MKRRRGNGEGSIFQRADGRWVASLTTGYSGKGLQARKDYYGRSRAEVVRKLDEARKMLLEGRPLSPPKQTVGQFLVRWLQDVVHRNVSPKTYRTYSDLIAKHLTPGLGQIDLQKLDPQHVQHFLNVKGETGLSPTTVKHLRDCLRAALNVAMRWNLLVRNPASLAKPPKRVRRKPHVYNQDEAQAFLQEIKGHRLETLFLVALCIGVREGEVLALGWSEVDLERKIIHIRHSLQRVNGKLQLVPTKTEESQRTIRLPDLVVSSLAAHRERQLLEREVAGDDWVETGRVFTTARGTMLDARNLLRSYYVLREVAALPVIRFHDLRHSAATLLRATGIPTPAISKLLGHASTRTTEEVYSHVLPDMERQAAAKMDEILNPVAVNVAVKTRARKPQ